MSGSAPEPWVLAPVFSSVDGDSPVLSRACVEEAAASIVEHGLVIIPGLYSDAPLATMKRKLAQRADGIMADLEAKGEKDGLKIGSVNGFHEVCLRSPGRYDLTSSFSDFSDGHLRALEDIVTDSRILADECKPAFCGVVLAMPGSPAQEWHADSLHLVAEEAPPTLVNGLVALHDIPLQMGPTEFVPGSHQLTNHFTNPSVPGLQLVYQEGKVDPLGIAPHLQCYKTPLTAGSVVLFDDRVLHRGGGNDSEDLRYVGYFSYQRKWVELDTHFEAERSLYQEAEEPPPCLGTRVRAEFPAVVAADERGHVFADGAGGSQVHRSVMEAVQHQMLVGAANIGGEYSTSELCLDISARARGAAADFFNCAQEEVTFGHNMTSLAFHLSHSLAAEFRGRGGNVVLSHLEHDANCGPWLQLAATAGLEVRWIPLSGADCQLDLSTLDALVDDDTVLVACGYASNAVGTITDVKRVCSAARAHGALSFVDSTAYAPHSLLDVQDVGCDFMGCSPYKFFGPHAGLLYGRQDVMARLPASKIRPATNELPSEATWQISRWEQGTQNFEAMAGVEACVNYVASLGTRFGGAGTNAGRRCALVAGWSAVGQHEMELKRRFLAGVQDMPSMQVLGLEDPSQRHLREPTFAVARREPGGGFVHPELLTSALCRAGVYCTSGNHYATLWSTALGLSDTDGACRVSLLHYNTAADVDRILDALEHAPHHS